MTGGPVKPAPPLTGGPALPADKSGVYGKSGPCGSAVSTPTIVSSGFAVCNDYPGWREVPGFPAWGGATPEMQPRMTTGAKINRGKMGPRDFDGRIRLPALIGVNAALMQSRKATGQQGNKGADAMPTPPTLCS